MTILYPILRVENPKNSILPNRYFKLSFTNDEKDLIKELFRENKIFDPSKLDFEPYSSFIDEESKFSKEISSYYSSFQIHWLIKLKASYSFNINFAGEKIRISSSLHNLDEQIHSSIFNIDNLDELSLKIEEICDFEFFKVIFNLEKKKEKLIEMYKNFENILEFLLTIQAVYTPYGKSGAKYNKISDGNWYEKRSKFNPKEELEKLKFTIQEVTNIYGIFSEITNKILGVKRDDWIQLWKSIGWNKKDRLEGSVRLGIEYLQWASMIKQFIEDYCGREILDIDEMSGISRDDILKHDPSKMDGIKRLLRDIRIRKYSDHEKKRNYYHDTYKRLFILQMILN
jgi:hypothetical protein